MYISIQGDIDAGMTENFAECFDIESEFHTSGSKSMAQCMEICFWQDQPAVLLLLGRTGGHLGQGLLSAAEWLDRAGAPGAGQDPYMDHAAFYDLQ